MLEMYGRKWLIPKVSADCLRYDMKLLNYIPNEQYQTLETIKTGMFIETQLVENLNLAKDKIDKYYDIYVKYRDIIIRKKKTYGKFKSKYHTFNKLYQSLKLTGVNYENIKTAFDLCFAPGAFIEGLLRLCPNLEHIYGITLIDDKDSFKIDKDIIKNKKFEQISPDDGNLYNYDNLNLSIDKLGRNKIDLVSSDGGILVRGHFDENLQSLYNFRLIFSEFIYGLTFVNENGTFICKLYDCFDKQTNVLIALCSIFYDDVYITKPAESRFVNSERYIVCKRLFYNTEKENIYNYLVTLFEHMDDTKTPTFVFDFPSDYLKQIKIINKQYAETQLLSIIRTLKCALNLHEKQTKK